MTDPGAFSCACALQHDLCDKAMDVVSGRIEMSLMSGDSPEALLWHDVREAILQIDLIACCRFSIDGDQSGLLLLHETGAGPLTTARGVMSLAQTYALVPGHPGGSQGQSVSPDAQRDD